MILNTQQEFRAGENLIIIIFGHYQIHQLTLKTEVEKINHCSLPRFQGYLGEWFVNISSTRCA